MKQNDIVMKKINNIKFYLDQFKMSIPIRWYAH